METPPDRHAPETFTKAPSIEFELDVTAAAPIRARFPGEEPPLGLGVEGCEEPVYAVVGIERKAGGITAKAETPGADNLGTGLDHREANSNPLLGPHDDVPVQE